LSPQGISIKFPKDGFSEMFAFQFYPILFSHNSISMYINVRGAKGKQFYDLILGSEAFLGFYVGGHAHYFRKICDGPINLA